MYPLGATALSCCIVQTIGLGRLVANAFDLHAHSQLSQRNLHVVVHNQRENFFRNVEDDVEI